MPSFATIANPFHALLKKKATWRWGDVEDEARARLVESLSTAPVVAHFDDALDVIIQTDASGEGLSAVMAQDHGDGLRPVAFISRALNGAEANYHAIELECLAVVWALKKLRTYVYDRRFTVQTDSSAIRWMMSKKELSDKFARWVLSLQEYDFDISHIKGSKNLVADALFCSNVTKLPLLVI